MPMKLSVGLTRKVGQPNFGSLGASCAVELDVDLDGSDLEGDPAEFRRRVRVAYAACARAVREELDRHQAVRPEVLAEGHSRRTVVSGSSRRSATAAQVRTLRRLVEQRGLELDTVIGERFGVDGPEGLFVAEASRLIGELQAAPA